MVRSFCGAEIRHLWFQLYWSSEIWQMETPTVATPRVLSLLTEAIYATHWHTVQTAHYTPGRRVNVCKYIFVYCLHYAMLGVA